MLRVRISALATSHQCILGLPSLRGWLMSTSCGWEGKGRYGSFRLRMNVWVCRWNWEIPWEHVPYLSASAVVIHYEEALYQVCAPLPLYAPSPNMSCWDHPRLASSAVRRCTLINVVIGIPNFSHQFNLSLAVLNWVILNWIFLLSLYFFALCNIY